MGLGGLLALRAGNGLDGAERSVEPGLLGRLNLVERQTQMVLQVLHGERREEGRSGGRRSSVSPRDMQASPFTYLLAYVAIKKCIH